MPARFSVSATRDYFVSDGVPQFYLADSVWNAFSAASIENWSEYLTYRRAQGFNAIQLSVLPIPYDASDTGVHATPFRIGRGGRWDFHKVNPAYFRRAARMVAMAREQGFTCALAVLWGNYLRDTWAARRSPGYQMPKDALKSYAELVARTFSKYAPIYLISGSTKFETDGIEAAYLTVLETIKAADPEALTSMHMATHTHLPDRFVNARALDFYGYQSGHRIEYQDMTYKLAQHYHHAVARRPIVNLEPLFEGHGYSKGNFGRFDAFSVRRAFWQSVLAGAKAGFTYGAHGMWSWHQRGRAFTSTYNSQVPYDWRTAIRFRGAWDISFSSWVFQQYRLFDIEPRNELLVNDTEEIRVAQSPDGRKIAIYSPYNVDIRLKANVADYHWTMIDLAQRNIGQADVILDGEETVIRMPEFNADAVYFGVK